MTTANGSTHLFFMKPAASTRAVHFKTIAPWLPPCTAEAAVSAEGMEGRRERGKEGWRWGGAHSPHVHF